MSSEKDEKSDVVSNIQANRHIDRGHSDETHEHCHNHNNIIECVQHSLKGITMGLLGFVIPFSLRYRKLTGLRKGVALASLFGSFRAVDCIIWRIITKFQEQKKSKLFLPSLLKKYHTGIAGGISALPVILIDKSSILNSTMVFWLIVRAIKSIVPSIPYGSVFIMCLSAGQILSTWVTTPDELSPSYLKFLYVQGGKSIPLMKQFSREYPPIQTSCELIHPGISCTHHFITFFFQGLRRALPVYIPIHLLSFYFSKRKNILLTLQNLFRSCSFLSLYCTLAWWGACIMSRNFPGVSRTKLFLCSWIAGLAIILEKEGRRNELAAYCMTHALDSAYNYLKKHKYVTPKDSVSALAVVWAIATIMQYHRYQPQFISRILFGIGMKKNTPLDN